MSSGQVSVNNDQAGAGSDQAGVSSAGGHARTAGWRALPLRVGDAEELLAEGVQLFEAVGELGPTLRWYRSDAPTIVLGRGQRTLRLAAGSHRVTTRFSGGGAVWLAPDMLSLDVLVPADHPWASGSIAAVFARVGECWAQALRDLGVDGLTVHDGPAEARRRGTPRERLLAAVCYATRGHGEVLWHGRKLVGLAQRRRRNGALVQCGLLRHWRPGHLLRRLGADPDDPEILHAAVGLADVLPDAPDDAAVIRAVEATFASVAP